MPLARYFAGRIHRSCLAHEHRKRINMTKEALSDLSLWLRFLKLAQSGISINLVLERRPDGIYITDSCEHVIGGFSLKTGGAFRWSISPHLRFRVSNNVLEHVAEIVAI